MLRHGPPEEQRAPCDRLDSTEARGRSQTMSSVKNIPAVSELINSIRVYSSGLKAQAPGFKLYRNLLAKGRGGADSDFFRKINRPMARMADAWRCIAFEGIPGSARKWGTSGRTDANRAIRGFRRNAGGLCDLGSITFDTDFRRSGSGTSSPCSLSGPPSRSTTESGS